MFGKTVFINDVIMMTKTIYYKRDRLLNDSNVYNSWLSNSITKTIPCLILGISENGNLITMPLLNRKLFYVTPGWTNSINISNKILKISEDMLDSKTKIILKKTLKKIYGDSRN